MTNELSKTNVLEYEARSPDDTWRSGNLVLTGFASGRPITSAHTQFVSAPNLEVRGKLSKGARLWLKPACEGENSSWVIRDGARTVRTGCSPSDRGEAEKRLSTYLVEKYKPKRDQKLGPSAVYIADLISIYCSHVADKIRRPQELGQRATRLLAFFAGKKLSEINGQVCRDYADQRGSLSMAGVSSRI
jgi:hypothetical protein